MSELENVARLLEAKVNELQSELESLKAENDRMKQAMEGIIKDLSRKNSDGSIALEIALTTKTTKP